MIRPLNCERRFSIILSIFLAASLIFSFSLALSTTLPSFERLAPISEAVQTPTGLAIDQQGRIYVTETTSNTVLVFSQGNRLLHSISGQQEPVCVTVGANGRIYIGNKKTGNVTVYDKQYSLLFKLGRGDGEFGMPSAIAVDNISNTIYVADSTQSIVKLYTGNGSFSRTLGQPGNGNGQFHQPVSIAVDTAAGELAVLDWQQRPDTFYGTMINGARIQYFDLNGNFLRGYSRFGHNIDAGQLAKPIHIAIDGASRLYATDSLKQKVIVYDTNNTYLGYIDDAAHSLRTPIGLAIGSTNRLYVSSLLARRVEVYGLDQYSDMGIAPSSLSFQAVEGGPNPSPQAATISNTGNTILNWTAGNTGSWIDLAETSGSVQLSGSQDFAVNVDIDGLPPNTYRDTIDITVDSGAAETIDVFLTVAPNPLQLDPMSLTFDTPTGTTPTGQALSVSTGGDNPVDWTAAVDQEWLSISPTSGSTPAEVRVYIAAENMTAGAYNGSVTFSNPQDPSAPVQVTVTLNLTDPSDPPGSDPPGLPVKGHGDSSKKWTLTQILPGTSLNGIWGSSAKDIFAVGAQGVIFHNDGSGWSPVDTGNNSTLHSIWGTSPIDVYAVGDDGVVLHYDGKEWSLVAAATQDTLQDISGTEPRVMTVDTFGSILADPFTNSHESGVALRSIWGSSDADIFVTGEAGAVLHYDGSSWTPMTSNTSQWLNSVWGSSGKNVFAVGENGTIIHYDGTKWSVMESGTTVALHSVWGSSREDVFAVGASGVILHFNGTAWSTISSGTTVRLNDVWVSPRSEVYAVGEDGIIISGKGKFPWMQFVNGIILVNAAAKNEDDENTFVKGPMPTKILKGAE